MNVLIPDCRSIIFSGDFASVYGSGRLLISLWMHNVLTGHGNDDLLMRECRMWADMVHDCHEIRRCCLSLRILEVYNLICRILNRVPDSDLIEGWVREAYECYKTGESGIDFSDLRRSVLSNAKSGSLYFQEKPLRMVCDMIGGWLEEISDEGNSFVIRDVSDVVRADALCEENLSVYCRNGDDIRRNVILEIERVSGLVAELQDDMAEALLVFLRHNPGVVKDSAGIEIELMRRLSYSDRVNEYERMSYSVDLENLQLENCM